MKDSDAITWLMTTVADLSEKLEKIEGTEAVREAKNVLTDLKRERNLARSERETSAAEMATLADRMNNMNEELQVAREKTIAEVEKKEKSTRAKDLLLQTKLADLELQMASMEQNLQEKAITLQGLQQDIDRSFANAAVLKDRIHHDEGSIRKAAYEAAEYSVKALNDKKMSEEIQRQMRILNPTAFAEPEETQEV
nr:hypothetical protein 1 [bacterium]